MKKILSLILAFALLLSLAACGKDAEEPQTEATTEPTGTVSIETAAPAPATEPTEETAPAIETIEIALGETLVTDFVEMTFTDVIIDADVKYSVTTGIVTRITGPEPVAGQKYICLTGTIKNTSTSALPVYDFFIGNFDLDGYNYSVDANDCDILDGEGQTEYEIDPLMEYTFRLYVAIPESLADSHTSCTFHFGFYDLFDNQELSYNRSFEDDPIALCPYQFILTIK